jgi:crotonobetainyl-CoA:carnitine CoA-transferase CaiB-like acyl-CoA transferase
MGPAAKATPMSEGSAGPLEGVLVADFSRVLAGPLATMLLADLGAEVVKVERPDGGDDTRAWGPPFTDDGESSYFLAVNRGKRSVTLDLRDLGDLERAKALAMRADVLVENFRAGVMEGFGLGWEHLRSANPRLVYCRVSGFGRHADLPGYDFLAQALSGLMSITGQPDGPPTKTGVAIVDVLTGLFATIGILAGLAVRDRDGRGQLVEANLLSSAIAGQVNQASAFLTPGTVPQAMGNRHPSIAPYETLATADSPLALAVGNDRQFRVLCTALGIPDASDDPRWATNTARVENRESLVSRLEAALAKRSAQAWVEVLRDHGVPCGPIHDIAEAFRFAASVGLEPACDLTRSDGSWVTQIANPLQFSATPVRYRNAPPRLAEHDVEVRAWLDEFVAGEQGGRQGQEGAGE